MKFNFLFKAFILGLVTIFVVSCDKDYNEIGTDIVNDDHYLFEKDVTKSIIAYNQKIGPVQTNDLAVNALGYYNNPVFGKTKASYVTQLELATLAPTFKTHVVIDSVHLYIPYFSTFISKDSDSGNSTYELDSIQGTAKIDLQIYENGYFLRDFDPSPESDLTTAQKYYSDQTQQFDDAKIGSKLNNSTDSPGENSEFGFSPAEIKLNYIKDGETVVKERKTPGMSLLLDKAFFLNKIINAPASKLVNNNVFKEYFRGLYFKVNNSSVSPEQGSMSMLDFKQGKITISYHQDKVISVEQSPDADRERKTFVLNISGKSVNLFVNDNNSVYESAITGIVPPTGQERLYLKGQEGAMTVISLFGDEDNYGYDANGILVNGFNGVADELDDLRHPADGKKWLVNEASITFNIDQDAMLNSPEADRIMLYDLTNNRPIIDYYNDNSSSGVTAKHNKLVHSGIIVKEGLPDEKGIKYKIRITNHIRSLIQNNDSTNVKLGLIVTENIGTTINQKLKTPASTLVNRVPTASVMNPRGTVIYGSTKQSVNVPEDKRLKLEIYYTKPD
jgi:hypothetical protein